MIDETAGELFCIAEPDLSNGHEIDLGKGVFMQGTALPVVLAFMRGGYLVRFNGNRTHRRSCLNERQLLFDLRGRINGNDEDYAAAYRKGTDDRKGRPGDSGLCEES